MYADTIKSIVRPTSPRFRRSRQPEPGSCSTHQPKILFRQAEPTSVHHRPDGIMPWATIVRTTDRQSDDGVGRDAGGCGMTAMRALTFFVTAATKCIAICCTAQQPWRLGPTWQQGSEAPSSANGTARCLTRFPPPQAFSSRSRRSGAAWPTASPTGSRSGVHRLSSHC
jgi:hypothetical protein